MRIPRFTTRAVLTFAISATAFGASAGLRAPGGLLVNGVCNPLAVEGEAVRFTWRSSDSGRGASQTAYQILVGSNREFRDQKQEAGNRNPSALISDLRSPISVWWDSGKVNSTRSASVEYVGRSLPSARRFWWKVRVWGETGKPSPYSAPAFFDTGLNQNEWTARYIWDGTTNPNNFAYFRKAFTVTRRPRLAKAYVTAHNDYLLYFNGHLLGRGPARCDPYHYGQYNSYDITQWVNIGTNVFAAMGHWHGLFNDSGINAKPAFLLETRFDYADGSSSAIGTDDSWKILAHTPFIETNTISFSVVEPRPQAPPKNRSNPPHMWTIPDETTHLPPQFVECDWLNGGASNRAAIQFDSRLEPAGWKTAGFDDSAWASATVVNRSLYRLFAQMAPMQREQAELKLVSVTSTNGAWLGDFGRCVNGWPKLTMRNNRSGDKIRIEYFQMTGEQYPAGWDEYTCSGGYRNLERGLRPTHLVPGSEDHRLRRKVEGFGRAGDVGLL